MKKTLVILAAIFALGFSIEHFTWIDVTGQATMRGGITLSSPTGPTVKSGTGAPSGSVTAPQGSLFARTDTPSLYQNVDGSTGWTRFQPPPPSTGLDGTCNFDGVATPVCGATLSGSTYTLTRDIWPASEVIPSGVTIDANNYRQIGIAITDNGSNGCNGLNASGATGGAGRTATFFGASTNGGGGGNGTAGAAANGGVSMPPLPGLTAKSTALGGSAGTGGGGLVGDAIGRGGGGGWDGVHSGGNGGQTVILAEATVGGYGIDELRHGRASFTSGTPLTAATGGGGGAGAGAGSVGGGGGGGACTLYVEFQTCLGTGTYKSHGGNATAGTGTNAGGGAGGGGWLAVVICGRAAGSWTVDVGGGSGGAGVGTGAAGASGASGLAIVPVTP